MSIAIATTVAWISGYFVQSRRQGYEAPHPQLPEFTAAAIKVFAQRELG